MKTPKPFQLAYKNLKDSLRKWMKATEGFEDKNSCPEGRLPPYVIRGRIDQAAAHIEAYIKFLKRMPKNKRNDWVSFLVDNAYRHVRYYPEEIDQALHDGTNAIQNHCEDASVFLSWQAVCGAVESFARFAALELRELGSKYSDDYA